MSFYNNGQAIPHWSGDAQPLEWSPDHVLFTFGGLVGDDDKYIERYAILVDPTDENFNEVYECLAAGAIPWDDMCDLEVVRHQYLDSGVSIENISLVLNFETEADDNEY